MKLSQSDGRFSGAPHEERARPFPDGEVPEAEHDAGELFEADFARFRKAQFGAQFKFDAHCTAARLRMHRCAVDAGRREKTSSDGRRRAGPVRYRTDETDGYRTSGPAVQRYVTVPVPTDGRTGNGTVNR